jgi:adenosyl cobinamide kinase/adenosyl cobinamide phosphate guanylyltransferase
MPAGKEGHATAVASTIPGYAAGMSATEEELHSLVEQLPADKTDHWRQVGESEDARHRLSKLDVQGNEIILLERMTVGEGFELRYEVRVFTEESEARAEVSVPVRRY